METRPVARVALVLGEAKRSRPLTDGVVQKLLEQKGEPGVYVLISQEKADLEAIRDLAVQGVEVESGLPGPMRESGEIFRINEGEKNLHRDGLPLDSQEMPRLLQALVQGLGRIIPLGDESMGDSWRKGEVERLHQTPAYDIIIIIMITNGNSRTDQVRAGMVYQRLQLAGAVVGISECSR